MADARHPRIEDLAVWAGGVAVVELVLLRIGTRTLVHIPGVDTLSGPLAWLSETGRFAYYFSLVLVAGVGWALLRSWWVSDSPSRWSGALALVGFAAAAAGGAVGVLSPSLVGWASLTALVLLVVGSTTRGRATIPVLLWAAAVCSSGLAVLLQGEGGGLTGDAVARLLQTGDILAVAGAGTFPLLLSKRPSRGPLLTGVTLAVVVVALLDLASSTTTILALWAFGITASLPPLVYALAAAGMAITVHQAALDGDRQTVATTLLVVAGGIGLVSTYQTGLVIVGLALAVARSHRLEPEPEPAPRPMLVGTG